MSMEEEALIEGYEQTPTQVMAEEGVMKVITSQVRKTLIIEGENVGNGQHDDEVNEENSGGGVSSYFKSSDSFLYTQNGPAIGIALSSTEELREIYLKKIFVVPPNHELYCPSCNVCIDKVFLCTTQQPQPWNLHSDPKLPVIQPLVPKPAPPVTQPVDPEPVHPVVIEPPVRCCACFTVLIDQGKQFFTGLVSRVPQGSESESRSEELSISVAADPLATPLLATQPGNSKGWEVLKSIVYGGLAELLASLSVVTSAASADASTLSIVALGIANLIGGLSVLGHNLRDLKSSQPRREDGNDSEEQVDKYYELLGKRENFILHAFVAILSFLIFGLVPPIVYGFTFRESNDKDLKLAAVAGASLICITLLGIAKAYIQRSNSYMTYFKTVSFYVTSGVLASLLTYLAGASMKRLVEQLGWFEPKSNFGLSLPGMSTDKSWGSY